MQVVKSEVTRKPYLDGLRGVAAVMVFFAHLTIALMPAFVTFSPGETHSTLDVAIGLSPLALVWAGNFAVCIFFVLSGFVLADFCSLSKISFPAKMVRRYFRLALPMLITSAFAWLIMVLGLYKNFDAAVEVTRSGWLSMWYRAFEPNLLGMAKEALYGAFVDGRANYNSNLWTMQIELIGSTYVFLLHTLFRNKALRIIAALVFYWLNHKNYYSLFAIGAVLFDLDGLLSHLTATVLPTARLRECVMVFLFALGAFCGAFPYVQPGMTAVWHAWLWKSTDANVWHMIGAQILIFALLRSTLMQRVMGGSTARYLGRLSFVLYLIHIPIICSLAAWLAYGLHDLPYVIVVVVTAATTMVAVFGASTALYLYVDVYTTAFSRYAGKMIDSWFSVPAPSALPLGRVGLAPPSR